MPTYEYRCRSCGHELEVVQSFTDDTLTVCPSCNGSTLRKVFGSIGITFKGSGFYKTDSRAGSPSSVARTTHDSESGPSADGASSSDSGGDSKTKESSKGATVEPVKEPAAKGKQEPTSSKSSAKSKQKSSPST